MALEADLKQYVDGYLSNRAHLTWPGALVYKCFVEGKKKPVYVLKRPGMTDAMLNHPDMPDHWNTFREACGNLNALTRAERQQRAMDKEDQVG